MATARKALQEKVAKIDAAMKLISEELCLESDFDLEIQRLYGLDGYLRAMRQLDGVLSKAPVYWDYLKESIEWEEKQADLLP